MKDKTKLIIAIVFIALLLSGIQIFSGKGKTVLIFIL